jgi:anthranilate 1,2-dioxygenase small subunit/terephthalate 1,2-dioxygenase oxygenase component beta subunit
MDSMAPRTADLTARLVELNAAYARAIDNEQFEQWPGLFLDPCLYKVTTAENVAKGLEAGIMYADSRGMLQDRVSALRKANIYERQRYRHIVGLPVVLGEDDGAANTETPFLIVRIMRDGTMEVFATGCYRDRVAADKAGALKFAERIVVCDGHRFDTLVAIPF